MTTEQVEILEGTLATGPGPMQIAAALVLAEAETRLSTARDEWIATGAQEATEAMGVAEMVRKRAVEHYKLIRSGPPEPTTTAFAASLLAEFMLAKEREILADPFAAFDRGPFGDRITTVLRAYRTARERAQ